VPIPALIRPTSQAFLGQNFGPAERFCQAKTRPRRACKVRQNGHAVRYLPGLLDANGDQHTSARVPKSPTDCGRLVGSHPKQIFVPFEY